MGNAGFISSAVVLQIEVAVRVLVVRMPRKLTWPIWKGILFQRTTHVVYSSGCIRLRFSSVLHSKNCLRRTSCPWWFACLPFSGARLLHRPVKRCIFSDTLSIKIAQRPYIIGSLDPKALKQESFEGKDMVC